MEGAQQADIGFLEEKQKQKLCVEHRLLGKVFFTGKQVGGGWR